MSVNEDDVLIALRDRLENSEEKTIGCIGHAGRKGGAYIVPAWIIIDAAAEIKRLRHDNDEQCRLNGMGSEREARQLAVIMEQRREIERLKEEKAADWKSCSESALAASVEINNLRAMVREFVHRP
jgi:hypothetical protein